MYSAHLAVMLARYKDEISDFLFGTRMFFVFISRLTGKCAAQ